MASMDCCCAPAAVLPTWGLPPARHRLQLADSNLQASTAMAAQRRWAKLAAPVAAPISLKQHRDKHRDEGEVNMRLSSCFPAGPEDLRRAGGGGFLLCEDNRVPAAWI